MPVTLGGSAPGPLAPTAAPRLPRATPADSLAPPARLVPARAHPGAAPLQGSPPQQPAGRPAAAGYSTPSILSSTSM
jgi:hypothetical protein